MSCYRSWVDQLQPEVELVGVQLPGRENRFCDPLIEDVHAAAHAVAQSMRELAGDLPYAFFGHSLGASLAYEVAQILHQECSRYAPRHLIVSGRRAPGVPRREKLLHLLPAHELKRELFELNCTPPEILQNDELMDMLMPRLRADFAMAENYVHRHATAVPCPISAFGGRSDKDVSPEDIEAWAPLTSGPFSITHFDGDHFFIHGAEQQVLAQVRAILASVQALA